MLPNATELPRQPHPEIPRFAQAGAELQHRWGARAFQVIGGGPISGMDLRVGDLLLLASDWVDGDLVMLSPRRFGRPMLARMSRKGPVAEPSGIVASHERWSVTGRVALWVRPEPQGSSRLVHLPERPQEELPLAAEPARVAPAASPALLLAFETDAAPGVSKLLARRLPGVRALDARRFLVTGLPALSTAPMALAESLSAELWARFRLSARVLVAPSAEVAARLIQRLPHGAIGALDGEIELAEPARAARPERVIEASPARAEAPRSSSPQLGLWSA
jgi:hypothetical protein